MDCAAELFRDRETLIVAERTPRTTGRLTPQAAARVNRKVGLDAASGVAAGEEQHLYDLSNERANGCFGAENVASDEGAVRSGPERV